MHVHESDHAEACRPALLAGILHDRESSDDEELEQLLLEDLADETLVNNQALARKDPLFISALALLVLAIVVELTGKL